MTRALAAALAMLAVSGCGGGHSSKDTPNPNLAPNAVRIVATASNDTRGDLQKFHSEKRLNPPVIDVTMGPAEGTSPGFIFMTPRSADPKFPSGPTILDARGRVRWFQPLPGRVAGDLESHVFKGKPVLAWGERPPVTAPPELFKLAPKDVWFRVIDQRYRELFKVRMIGRDVTTDLHEFKISKRDTALLLGFRRVTRDLSTLGTTPSSTVIDAVMQEIDLKTGKLLLNWSALAHIPLSDSMFTLPRSEEPWDAYHPNSIALTKDGDILLSMRHTSAIYKIDRRTGKVLWTFGGKSSDFEVSRRDTFYFQHDAQPTGDGKVLLFDNAATFLDHRADFSRVMEFKLDGKTGQAKLVRQFAHDPATLVVSQGNARRLPNGNIFVGWGNQEFFSEYTPEGQQVFDAEVPSNAYQTYRSLKGGWVGKPTSRPEVVADRRRNRTLIWVSWNGATEVTRWQVLGGDTRTKLKRLGTGRWENFETRLDVAADPRYIRVQALDKSGKILGSSRVVRAG